MAYITLEELKKILPGILDQWIDGDDEGWEWIFQEIEQKCHVGKKKKKKYNKRVDIDALIQRVQDLNKEVEEMHRDFIDTKNNVTQLRLSIKDIGAEIKHIREDSKAAKSMAETAKQRTEVDYSKYSGKSDGKISYENPEDKNCRLCKYGDGEGNCCSPLPTCESKVKNDSSRSYNECVSCKYMLKEPSEQPCVGCRYNGINNSGIDKWEAKDE